MIAILYAHNFSRQVKVKPLFTTFTFILILIAGTVGFSQPSHSQASPPANVSVSAQTDKEVELIKEQYKNLKEQNKDMMSRLENERTNHYKFVERTYSEMKLFFVFAASSLLVVLTFFNWKTKKDLEADLKKNTEKLEKEVEEFKQSAKTKAELVFSEVIQQEVGGLKVKFSDLHQIVDSNTRYKKKKITIIGDSKQIESINDAIEKLNKKKFESIKIVDESGFDVTSFNPSSSDLIIYLFKERDKNLPTDKSQPIDSNILDILRILKGSNLPVILYAPNNIRVPSDILSEYEWILPANSQITLMNGIFTISNLL